MDPAGLIARGCSRAALLGPAALVGLSIVVGGCVALDPAGVGGPMTLAGNPAPDPYAAVVRVVERIMPSVVNIGVVADGPAGRILGRERRGSGVIIDERGHVLTASHVVLGAVDLTVTLSDGREAKATLAGLDSDSGLALLHVPLPDLPTAPLGRAAEARMGQLGIALSSLGGRERAVTTGVISAFPPFEGYWEYRLERAIQTDAPINPGSSGGPLVTASGQVVGILSFSQSEAQGINFAIPVDLIAGVLDEIVTHGRPRSKPIRPWIGSYTVSAPNGVGVIGVVPGGPAERAGLKQRDVIARINGQAVTTREAFYRALWAGRVGDEVECTVRRGDETLSVRIRTEDRHEFYRVEGSGRRASDFRLSTSDCRFDVEKSGTSIPLSLRGSAAAVPSPSVICLSRNWAGSALAMAFAFGRPKS